MGVTIWLPDSKQRESPLLKSNALASPNAAERILAISATDDGQYLDVVQGNANWSRRDAHTGSDADHIGFGNTALYKTLRKFFYKLV